MTQTSKLILFVLELRSVTQRGCISKYFATTRIRKSYSKKYEWAKPDTQTYIKTMKALGFVISLKGTSASQGGSSTITNTGAASCGAAASCGGCAGCGAC
jgi:hypothetical protein